jgi:hypothetical protein
MERKGQVLGGRWVRERIVFDERRRQGEQSAKRLDVGPIVRKGYLGKETPLEGQNSR